MQKWTALQDKLGAKLTDLNVAITDAVRLIKNKKICKIEKGNKNNGIEGEPDETEGDGGDENISNISREDEAEIHRGLEMLFRQVADRRAKCFRDIEENRKRLLNFLSMEGSWYVRWMHTNSSR